MRRPSIRPNSHFFLALGHSFSFLLVTILPIFPVLPPLILGVPTSRKAVRDALALSNSHIASAVACSRPDLARPRCEPLPSMPPKGTQPKGKQPKASSPSNAPASKPGPALVAPKAITHPEHHHTLNHLHQVAAFYAVLSSTSASTSSSSSSDAACRLQGEMVRSAKVLSRKAVIRLDTGVKRGSCPRCDTVWMEGLTVHVRSRVSGPHGHILKWKCGVCGVLVRRPAPDLVPQFDKAQEKSEKKQPLKRTKTQDPKVKRLAEEKKEAEKQQKKAKISQRQRRRTASIKRQLLRAAEAAAPTQVVVEKDAAAPEASTGPSEASPAAPAPAPASEPPAAVKLSRGQKRKQRLEKHALRSNSAGAAPQKRGRRKIPQLRPDELRVPPIYTFADQVYYDKGSPRAITVSSTCSTPPPLSPAAAPAANDKRGVPAGKIVRTQRPQLPHFNDRTEHSHWDSPFTALHNHLHPPAAPTAEPSPDHHSATHDPVGAFSCQALQYWEKAARSRGDHRLITGVGKNGALGPTLP